MGSLSTLGRSAKTSYKSGVIRIIHIGPRETQKVAETTFTALKVLTIQLISSKLPRVSNLCGREIEKLFYG